ncbi:hypothetical protein FXO37_08585 [Capsicum annuum]|nr:hypothetical protein FXO37_08585 [Capsicum annuum]
MMTTNIAESLNSVLIDEREYPMSYFFNSIAKNFCEKFRERHVFVGSLNHKFVPCAKKILKENKSVSNSLFVSNANEDLSHFTVFGNGATAKVNHLERSCSFRKYDSVKLSCEHVMADLNDFDRLFHGLAEDHVYLEHELRWISYLLRKIMERLGMEGPDYITPPPSP